MKKLVLLALALSLLVGVAFAETMVPTDNRTPVYLSEPGMRMPATRTVPEFTFTVNPTSILTSYYDYMIGSYNGIPLRVIPDEQGGGYFLTYHGKRQPTATRRVFYSYIDASGAVINNNEITETQNNEGYPTLAVDPVSGKPMYAWHCNADADAAFEIQFASDAFLAGIAGLFNDLQVAVNGPVNMTSIHGTTTDNEFIWPTAQIGPSPVQGKRRIYLAGRNSVTHNAGPSENLYIAYADFNGDDIEMGTPLVWNYTSIPEMNDWNNDQEEWRRPFHAITTDNAGNIYYVGYHFAVDADDNSIEEPDMDVFMCDNYGQGTWTRVSAFSNIPTWNPPGQPGGTGYFVDANELPYPNDALSWNIANSSHLNAVVDSEGKIHVPAIWAYSTNEGTYYPAFQFMKEFIFDPTARNFSVKDIYPQKDPTDTFNQTFTPWDLEAPWGEAEYQTIEGEQYLATVTGWPFPHWDETAHTDAMMFHYNNVKISEGTPQGMMVAVWQDAWRARQFNYNSDTDYAQWANVPEINIAVTPDNGRTWSEPIVLNNIETPQMANIKPMWVYPADMVKYVGMQGENKVGKIGLMMYNDYTWGSNSITPPYHPTNDGGQVMFAELQIVFPVGQPMDSDDVTVTPTTSLLNQNYPNPFNPETTISFNIPAATNGSLNVYNVKGQLVKTLVNGPLAFGSHSFVWNGTDNNGSAVSSGVYYYRLTAGNHNETKKMVLVK